MSRGYKTVAHQLNWFPNSTRVCGISTDYTLNIGRILCQDNHRLTMRERPKLSAGEYLGAVYAVSRGVLAASWAALTGWRRGDDGAKSYGQHIIYSAARTTIPLISIKVNQAILGTTRNQYRIWTKKNKVAEDIVEIDKSTGLWGCWLGRREAGIERGKKGKTLLWLHGGGYVFAASEGHLKFLWNMVQQARKRGQVLQVLVLEYGELEVAGL